MRCARANARNPPLRRSETDVLVVGLGCAGASTALEAVAAGAEVVVVERASAGGGTSANSGGVIYLGGGTPIQKECGFEDSRRGDVQVPDGRLRQPS